MNDPDTTQRHLLIIGVGEYQPGWGDIREGVEAEVKRAEALFLDLFRYERTTFERLSDTTQTGIKNGIADWLERVPKSPNDFVTIYYTGHGLVDRSIFRLITRDVIRDRPATGISVNELIPVVWTGDRHVLLILDTCESGGGVAESMGLLGRLREADGGAARGFGLNIISTARSIENARTRAFMEALDQVVRAGDAGNSEDGFLRPDGVIEKVNRVLAEVGDTDRQHASLNLSSEALFCFLPNPGWDPRLRIGMAADSASVVLVRIQRTTMTTHWDPRARGVAMAGERGWMFTGRARAMRKVLSWMGTVGGGAGLVVTGPPGTGKSALLARIVTLADPAIRAKSEADNALADVPAEELPPLELVTVAIHARRKTAADVALELAVALGAALNSGETDPEAIARAAAKARATPATLIVDALDESQQPEQVATFLRSIVDRGPQVRLVVGLRSRGADDSLIRALGKRFERLDLGSNEYLKQADIRQYVEQYLVVEPSSPYRATEQAEHTKKVARAVAKRAGGSFLVASITARRLALNPAVIPSPELGDLPAEVGEAFEFDFKRFTLAEQEQAAAVFGALAFAQGRGLPRELWARFASVIDSGNDDPDIDRWLQHAGYYVTEDTEHGVPVCRLYHEEFARFLRKKAATLIGGHTGQSTNAEDLMAAALEATVPSTAAGARDWNAATPYARSYLVRHLRAAGRRASLCELVQDPGWIEARTERGDPSPLLQDLDAAIEAAREESPPDVITISRCCLAYGKRVATAPPLIVDVLAAAGQFERAAFVADNIAYSLDRCRAFCFLAERNAVDDPERAREQLGIATLASDSVGGSYRLMTSYWLVRAALALGDQESAKSLAGTAVFRTLWQAAKRGRKPGMSDVWDFWEQFRSLQGLDNPGTPLTWKELDHSLFWTAMVLRATGHEQGLGWIRELLAEDDNRGFNLQLQAAAVAGDDAYLSEFLPWGSQPRPGYGGILRGNLALALATAGRIADVDRLLEATRDQWQNPGDVMNDSSKRLAWALALCDRFDDALAYLELIAHPEERFRALHRVTEVMVAQSRNGELAKAADLAEKLLAVEEKERRRLDRSATTGTAGGKKSAKKAAPPDEIDRGRWRDFDVTDFWRLRTWAAWILQAAGRTRQSLALAEEVLAEEVNPSEVNSLARPTQSAVRMKHHVDTQVAQNPDREAMTRVFVLAAKGDIDEALKLAESIALPRYRARARAGVAIKLENREQALALWLEGVVDARRVGQGLVVEVLKRGRSPLLGRSAQGRAVLELIEATEAMPEWKPLRA